VIISSLGLIQRTILTKNINFKLLARISIVSSVISGTTGITMAYCGWGVWSLVWRTLCQNFVVVVLLWIWNRWKPILVFSTRAFQEMFSFGSKLLASGLIATVYNNVYYLIIGKYFSAADLGYYTRADSFRRIPSDTLTNIIGRVAYPVLSSMRDDDRRLKAGYKKLIKCTMLISFVLMIGMAAVAEPLIRTLIGAKWLFSVPYLELLCFAGMLYPLHALNLDMLNVKGRSDLFLKLEIIKKILVVPTIIIGIFLGIKVMIAGMIVNSIFAYFLNSSWSGVMINYPAKEQIADVMPSFLIALTMGIVVFLVGHSLTLKPAMILCIQVILGALFTAAAAKIFRLDAFMEMGRIVLERYTNR
jgi:O-antigen/teichoic acid export membrane protein